jgi:DNA-binding transcriptional LysR family regulator
MRTVAQALDGAPGLEVEPVPGRDLPSVAAALLRGESDAGFGRVHPLPDGRDAGLTHRLVRLEPVDVLLSAGHPLAGRDVLRPADLRDSVLRYPAAVDRLDFLTRFADRFGIERRAGSTNLGLEHFVEQVRAAPEEFSLVPADVPLPDRPGVRTVPLVEPTPLYAWSLLWRTESTRGNGAGTSTGSATGNATGTSTGNGAGNSPGTGSADQHPRLQPLLRAFAEEARRSRWLEYDPARDWLPGPDEAALNP